MLARSLLLCIHVYRCLSHPTVLHIEEVRNQGNIESYAIDAWLTWTEHQLKGASGVLQESMPSIARLCPWFAPILQESVPLGWVLCPACPTPTPGSKGDSIHYRGLARQCPDFRLCPLTASPQAPSHPLTILIWINISTMRWVILLRH